jgi:hypothetical protein
MNITEELNEALIKATKLCSEYKLLFNNYYTINNILEDYIKELLLIDPDIYDKIIEIPIVKFIEKHLGKGSLLHYKIIFNIMIFSLFISNYYTDTESIKILKKPLYDPDELADIAYDTYFELKEAEISDVSHFIENFNLKLNNIFYEIRTNIRELLHTDNKLNLEDEMYFKNIFDLVDLLYSCSMPIKLTKLQRIAEIIMKKQTLTKFFNSDIKK